MRKALWITAALLIGGPAWTQIPPRLEEVVVTAERREENLQHAAVAINVLTPQELMDAGVGKAQVGLLLPGKPHVGYRYYQEQAPGVTTDRVEKRVLRTSIDELRMGRTSIMPQGLDAQLSRDELRDLMAYLISLK